MSNVSMIYGKLNSLAPFATQESWDNSGLLVGDPGAEVKTALVVLDITAEAVREAREIGAELIISHHPVIFHPLKKVESGSVVWELAQAGISAICAHTNLDKARGGVNDCLAAALGLEHVTNYAVEGREKHYKLAVFVPVSHAEAVRHAMIGAGAGTIGGYTGCTFSHRTVCARRGYKPLAGTARTGGSGSGSASGNSRARRKTGCGADSHASGAPL